MSTGRTFIADFTYTCRDCGATITVRNGKEQPHDHVRPSIVIRDLNTEATT